MHNQTSLASCFCLRPSLAAVAFHNVLRLVLLVAVAACFLAANVATAQLFGSKDKQPSAAFVAEGAVMAAIAYPNEIVKSPFFKLYPYEVVSAWGKKELGFDPMLIEQMTFSLNAIDTENFRGPEWALAMSFEKMQGLAGNTIDELVETRVAGKTVYSAGQPGVPSFLVFDEATILVGEERYFERVVTANGTSSLAKVIKNSTVGGEAMLFVDVASLRPQIELLYSEIAESYDLPPALLALRELPELVETMEAGVDAKDEFETRVVMHAVSETGAERAREILINAMAFGKQLLIEQTGQSLDLSDPVQAATLAYTKRMADKFEARYTPEQRGKDLVLAIKDEAYLAPFLISFGAGASNMNYQPPRAKNPKNDLREIALGLLNYESAYQKFPESQIVDEETGQPLFHGAVKMLPFIEQNNLFSQLKLDEPWDSGDNRVLTNYVVPAFGNFGNGDLSVRFPVYPGSIWDDGGGKRFSDITDGSSNTILAIHAPGATSASWADPTPWKISTTNPMQDVFGDQEEIWVVLVDGSTRKLLRSEMTNTKLKAMLTVAGGEIVDF